MKKFLYKIIFFVTSFLVASLIVYHIFKPIFTANHIIFPYAIHPFDIVSVYPDTWILLKKVYFITFLFSYFILFNKIFNLISLKIPKISKKISYLEKSKTSNELSLLVGLSDNTPIFINEKGLYQNILITGTIGTGKTSSAMYPFTRSINRLQSF